MSSKHFFLFAYAALYALALSFTSCSSDEGDGNTTPPIVENQSVINMMKGSYEDATKLGNIYINESNNFTIYRSNYGYDMVIAPVGSVKGLANISGFPTDGYVEQTAVLKRHGYVLIPTTDCYEPLEKKDKWSRLFIEDEITDKAGHVLGYKVVYESPFYGKDQDIELPKTEIAFDSKGGIDTLLLENGEPMVVECVSSDKWCKVWGCELGGDVDHDYYSFPIIDGVVIYSKGDSIYPSSATVTLKTMYGKVKTIKVTQAAAKPRLALSQPCVCSLPTNGGYTNVNLDTNIPADKIEIDNSKATWCQAKLEYREDDGNPFGPTYAGSEYKRLKLTTDELGTNEKRSGTITLKYKDGEESITINVEQTPYDESGGYYGASGESGNHKISFTNNLENAYDVSANVDWIRQLYINNNRIKFDLERNYSYLDREGVITILDRYDNAIHSIKIVQHGAWAY